ncbi:hypothetical protein ACRZ5S_06720 [Vibrio scophthalmi]|uniref:hypothetical protein n=1 Tax=Vibrio scophthalmi TaxID=45658 RepID=UPI003EBCB26A
MKKVAFSVMLVSVLAGCQLTGGSNTDIANADFSKMSCDEIKQVFTDYQDTMDNVDTGSSLLSAVGVDSGVSESKAAMNSAYQQARKAANPVLKMKKCSFSI